jgi:hypothetical protein
MGEGGMMRVLVCGGRAYNNVANVWDTLDALQTSRPIALVIEGGAPGADRLARVWAQKHRVPLKTYSADWSRHGKAAGPIRNQRMIDDGKPDLVVAFPGGKGTTDMVQRAFAANVQVRRV